MLETSLFASSVAFTTPWLLGLLAVLPVLWWLLRLTPPAPRKIFFPALSLLREEVTPAQTPTHTPWWLLLLRMIIVTLLIFAFSNPILNPQSIPSGHGVLLIVVDNDWASARAWEIRKKTLHTIIHQAERDNRPVLLLATTPDSDGLNVRLQGPIAAKLAYAEAEKIKPQPWPAHWQQAIALFQQPDCPDFSETVWMSSGLGDIDTKSLYEIFHQKGSLKILSDDATPIYLLEPPQTEDDHLILKVYRSLKDTAATLSIAGFTNDGRRLTQVPARFEVGETQTTAPLNFPLDVRNQIRRFEIVGQETAATTVLLDGQWQKHSVGLVGNQSMLDEHSLLNGLFYIDRALKPFAEIHVDDLGALLKQKVSVIILTDATPISVSLRPILQTWIKQGGLLLRFAGRNMAASVGEVPDDLLPVVLHNGDRAMSGSLSWGTPQKLHAFSTSSPFYGLTIPEDVVVNRQVLAEPMPDLVAHSWVTLEDGTPLVTAKNIGQGTSVLFHIPVQTDWSNLPLSGLFVDMLRRVIDVAHGHGDENDFANLPPWRVLDAYGAEQKPGPGAMAIQPDEKDHIFLGPQHPPGLYGSETSNLALNVGSVVPPPEGLSGVGAENYSQREGEIEVQPYLLMIGLMLLLLDFGVSLYVRGMLSFVWRRGPAFMIVLMAIAGIVGGSRPCLAEATITQRSPIDLTAQTYLAYVQTDDAETNKVVQQGLTGLARILQQRTSIDQVAVTGVNPNRENLAFYPLLYWPIRSGDAPLSPQGIDHVNRYLHHGGMILLDSMDGEVVSPILLQHILSGLDIPPLVRLPQEHVLKHSFYILDEFPGRYNKSDFWLEPEDTSSYDGVATVLYGVNGWAAAWAVDDHGKPMFPCLPGGEVQREWAYRFGVNLVMYALTGNYKSDQLHAQNLLRKLGK